MRLKSKLSLVLIAALALSSAWVATGKDREIKPSELGAALSSSFKGHVAPIDAQLLKTYWRDAKYPVSSFPLKGTEFKAFQNQVSDFLKARLGWTNQTGPLYSVNELDKLKLDFGTLTPLVFELQRTGDRVPAVLCSPTAAKKPAPAVAVFSGHSKDGLLNLLQDNGNYQEALALQLCKEGYVTIALEKIDSGFMSHAFSSSGKLEEDENRLGLLALSSRTSLAARQLEAATASFEYLSKHADVDKEKLAVAGTSYGGWVSILVAILNSDAKVIVDFSMKDLFVEHFSGQGSPRTEVIDFSTVFLGMWQLGDRHIFPMAVLDRKMLYAYGYKDARNKESVENIMQPKIKAQLEVLGNAKNVEIHPYDGSDEMQTGVAIDYLNRILKN